MRIDPATGNLDAVSADPAVAEPIPGVQGLRRYPMLALGLGLIMPVVAFAYVGRPLIAIALASAQLLISVFMGQGGLVHTVAGMATYLVSVIAIEVFLRLAPLYIAREIDRTYVLRWCNRWWWYLALAVLSAGAGALILESRAGLVGFETFRIPSTSMTPTIRYGDFIVVDRRSPGVSELQHADLIVHRNEFESGQFWLRRIIGLPGDRINVDLFGVERNGQRLVEPYATSITLGSDGIPVSIVVPDGQCFLLADQRTLGIDSRQQGTYPCAQILGRATVIWWANNPSRVGKLERGEGHAVAQP